MNGQIFAASRHIADGELRACEALSAVVGVGVDAAEQSYRGTVLGKGRIDAGGAHARGEGRGAYAGHIDVVDAQVDDVQAAGAGDDEGVDADEVAVAGQVESFKIRLTKKDRDAERLAGPRDRHTIAVAGHGQGRLPLICGQWRAKRHINALQIENGPAVGGHLEGLQRFTVGGAVDVVDAIAGSPS